MKPIMKMFTATFALASMAAAVNAQTTDSLNTQNGNTINVPSETVVIADTTAPASTTSGNYSGSRETETIHVYSGSHNGNNINRTYEVPLPAESNSRSKPY